MISREFCRAQIVRLYQLRGYPKLSGEGSNENEVGAALKELLDALQTSESEESAKSAVEWFVHNSRECPVPSDIRRAVSPAIRLQEYIVVPTKCSDCGDTGYKRVVKTVQDNRYEFAVPCSHTGEQK